MHSYKILENLLNAFQAGRQAQEETQSYIIRLALTCMQAHAGPIQINSEQD